MPQFNFTMLLIGADIGAIYGKEAEKMPSQVFEIAQNVRETRRMMADCAARGWKWFVIRPNGKINSRHRTEPSARRNVNTFMLEAGHKIWKAGE